VEKICRVLGCKVDDIVDFVPDDPTPEQGTGTK
jgi:DNA-binding Xre family transcriptional regulator